jgi:lipoprotein-anchoring transpeptidase ErfK/SrfK
MLRRGFRTGAGLAVAALALLGAARDPGVRVRIDLANFELVAVDGRAPEAELRLPVATGSPGHPTRAGHFAPREVVRNPSWSPGATARAGGALPEPASEHTPMGVAKIPLASGFSVHGGASPIVVGKPVSLGCVRLSDPDMLALLDWLDRAGALAKPRKDENGEVHQALRRPVAFELR